MGSHVSDWGGNVEAWSHPNDLSQALAAENLVLRAELEQLRSRQHSTRMTLDVVMEDFWTRPTGVYSKPVWLRPSVLQLVYDDDITKLRTHVGAAVPGGHVAYTRTATVYSEAPILPSDLTITTMNQATDSLRKACPAFVQRVSNVYLVEANILGFAGESAGIEEQCVLSAAVKWALSDYAERFGEPPAQIVLHLDVNGTLALGDVAGTKTFGAMAKSLAADVLRRLEDTSSDMTLPKETRAAISRARSLDDERLREEYTVNYSGNDFTRAIFSCLGALAPAAIRDLDQELAAKEIVGKSFADIFTSASAKQAFERAFRADSIESPALTVAIRTNGVEHRQAAVYVQRLVCGVLGLELSEEKDTMRRYVVTHEDTARGLFFHPVLLEKLHKSNGAYTFVDYADELHALCGKRTDASAWKQVSDGALKKSDPKYKCYLGLCETAADAPDDFSSHPPTLDIAFSRETWLMPQANRKDGKHKDYKLLHANPESHGPWWAGFAESVLVHDDARGPSPGQHRRASFQPAPHRPDSPLGGHVRAFQPYNISIASEPVPRSRQTTKEICTQVDADLSLSFKRAGTADATHAVAVDAACQSAVLASAMIAATSNLATGVLAGVPAAEEAAVAWAPGWAARARARLCALSGRSGCGRRSSAVGGQRHLQAKGAVGPPGMSQDLSEALSGPLGACEA